MRMSTNNIASAAWLLLMLLTGQSVHSTVAACGFIANNYNYDTSSRCMQRNHNIAVRCVFEGCVSWRKQQSHHQFNFNRIKSSCTSLNAHSTSSATINAPLAPITTITTTGKERTSLHLISLPPKDDTFALPGESLVRECWRWKDSALGDGRDYFIPRPRALKAFHSLFVGMEITVLFGRNGNSNHGSLDESDLEVVLKLPSSEEGQSPVEVRLPLPHLLSSASILNVDDMPQSSKEYSFSETFVVEECAALSNCARLDVILVLKSIQQWQETEKKCDEDSSPALPTTKELADIATRHAVAYHLQQQISSKKRSDKSPSLLKRTGLASWLDLPGAIDKDATLPTNQQGSLTEEQCMEMYQLGQRLTSIEGAHPISTHLSLIAGGLAPRPNRPDREVIFRPYSSRDAHILLQLKRTVEVVSTWNPKDEYDTAMPGQGKKTATAKIKNVNGSHGRGRIKTLLDGALSAGKAARNEKVVPEIKKLKEYGSDGTPPVALANVVAEAAIEQAVQPTVAACVAKLVAMEADTSQRISQLRRRVNDIVVSLEENLVTFNVGDGSPQHKIQIQRMANKLLHAPTMQLREGRLSGAEDIDDVVKKIEEQLIMQMSET